MAISATRRPRALTTRSISPSPILRAWWRWGPVCYSQQPKAVSLSLTAICEGYISRKARLWLMRHYFAGKSWGSSYRQVSASAHDRHTCAHLGRPENGRSRRQLDDIHYRLDAGSPSWTRMRMKMKRKKEESTSKAALEMPTRDRLSAIRNRQYLTARRPVNPSVLVNSLISKSSRRWLQVQHALFFQAS